MSAVPPQTPVQPPPVELSADPVTNEPEAGAALELEVRGSVGQPVRRFGLRSDVPQALIGKLLKSVSGVSNLANKAPADWSDAEKQRNMVAVAASYDAITKLVVEGDRDEFVAHCEDVEPPMGAEEFGGLLATAIEAITGRPTGAS